MNLNVEDSNIDDNPVTTRGKNISVTHHTYINSSTRGLKWTATKTFFGVDTMSCDALQHVASTTEEEVTMF